MRILFVDPFENSLFSFRKELLDSLISEGHEIFLCIKTTKRIEEEYKTRVKEIINIDLNLKSKNLFNNLKTKTTYKNTIKRIEPDLIISYTIKPNIYCGLYAKNIPMIANITGLGNLFRKNNFLSALGIVLYKKSFKNVLYTLFQNEDILSFFKSNNIPLKKYKIIPGSGVNLNKFFPDTTKPETKTINFLFASRAIKEKGFNLLIQAIPKVININKNVHFNFLISNDDLRANKKLLKTIGNYSEFVTFLPKTNDMRNVYLENDFLVSPSFYKEGISNVLLESLACARPIITTFDNAGCKEVLKDNINGFGVSSNNLNYLVDVLCKASFLEKDVIYNMGLAGRKFVEEKFDRKIVIKTYLEIIKELESTTK